MVGEDGVVYRSERTVVSRLPSSPWGVGVIRIARLGPDAHQRTSREAAILQSLAGIPGVPRLLSAVTDTDLVVEDAHGVPLAGLVAAPEDGVGTPWRVHELLDFGISLTAVIAEIHRRGVIHGDISPANVLVHTSDRRPLLIDFEFAVSLADGTSRPAGAEITGTLAYLAPEQTGRTGRPIDQRTDLYALGATLYELACGRPPFGRGENGALDIIHDHLACRPEPLSAQCPELPESFSDVVDRLLAKEPDRRYQSAEGLLHDLRLIRAQLDSREADPLQDGTSPGAPMRLGTRDYAMRFQAPATPVAREEALAVLSQAWHQALTSHGGALLVTGAAGVGKTALVDQLRRSATSAGARWVSTAFTGDGPGHGIDEGIQALRAVARQLLADSEQDLLAHREVLLEMLGDQAGLLAGILPDFAVLLAVAPEPPSGDPAQIQAAVVQAAHAVLCAVPTPDRPLVFVLDGLQWATPFALDLLDAFVTRPAPAGLFVIATCRDDELDDQHPVTELRRRWERLEVDPPGIALATLTVHQLAELLAEVLRIEPDRAADLAEPVFAHTRGNPYDTIELLNTLRREATLRPGTDGWEWDVRRIHQHVGQGERSELLAGRIDGLPDTARTVLEVIACLGGDVDLALLAAATQTAAGALHRDLGPSLAEGLLVVGASGDLEGGDALRLRHDRIRQVVLGRLGSRERFALHLRIARRLRDSAGHDLVAAEQYLAGLGQLSDPDEVSAVVDLFTAVADDLRVTSPMTAERYLEAASVLLEVPREGGPLPSDAVRALGLKISRHAALYALGRFDEADELYEAIAATPAEGYERFAAGAVQVASLTNRARPGEAVTLAVHLLEQLGLSVPPSDRLDDAIESGLDDLYRWVEQGEATAGTEEAGQGSDGDVSRPEIVDPRVLAAAGVIAVAMPPAFFSDQAVMTWLVLESRRLWADHGPCRALVAPLCHAAVVTISRRQDFLVGYRVVRRVLDASIARRYEPETARARFLFAVSAGHWFEPLQSVVDEARLARESLLAGGDSQGAVFTYHSTIPSLLDLATSLPEFVATVDEGLSLATRAGNDQTRAAAQPYRSIATALRGTAAATGPVATPEDEDVVDAQINPMAAVNGHLARATVAAVLGDPASLARHARAAVPLLPFLAGHYAMARVHLLHALAAAQDLRQPHDEAESTALRAELDACRAWLARRAQDSPESFAHLLGLVDAERAWAVGDVASARAAFDRALRQVGEAVRPWHQAYLLERAGLFAREQGETYLGGLLLGRALQAYATWGAARKVEQLQHAFPFLRDARTGGSAASGRATVIGLTSDSLDLLSVLKASQALSRETDLQELRDRVVDVLTSMSGATSVTVLLKANGEWAPPVRTTGTGTPDASTPAVSTGVPMSVVRYAERTGEPVVVADTATDHRFTADPYLSGSGGGSLLVVPIRSRGDIRVMVVLENSLHRGVFSADRLDAVMLVAGQLAVSFDIALARRQLELESDRRLQLLDTLRSREQLLETLLSIQRDISHRAPLQTVLDAVTAGASGLLGGSYVALVMADHASDDEHRIPSSCGDAPGHDADALILAMANESIADDATVSREAGSAAEDPTGDPDELATVTATPVHASGQLIGSLVLWTKGHRGDLAERQGLLAAFAEQVSLALNDATTLEEIRAASLDALTGLATRRLFLGQLEVAVQRHPGQVTVLFIDLDRFKQVNDSLGHEAGDRLLAGVAERLRSCIRDTDVAARLGGDEFAVLLEGTPGPAVGLRVGEALTTALLKPFRIAGKEIYAGASIGVALSTPQTPSAAELLREADLAMYRAKRERSRHPVLFEPRMHEDVTKRLDLEGDLQRAVAGLERGTANQQLWLQFQPQVTLDDARVVGLEALVRWTHPQRGPVSPAEFIPIAEDTGVVHDLGRWVLQEACRQVARWRREVHPALTVSVNISGRQLTEALVGEVAEALSRAGLDADALTLELTESVLLTDPAQSQSRLEELKRLGVLLSLDDFGTGYSSLSYLHRFKVDELKVDKSFIDKIADSDGDLAIVQAVLELARILDLRTVAEGIETSEQRDLLRQLNCQVGQGYLFSRPLDAASVPAFLTPQRLPRQRGHERSAPIARRPQIIG